MASNLRKYRPKASQDSCGDRGPSRGHSAPTEVGELDATKRDRFELLSAYLDGEVTADERRQVNGWLANDPNVQCLYERLLALRRGMTRLPVPDQERCIESTVNRIVSQGRRRLAVLAGAGTIAVVCLGTVSGFFGDRPGSFRFAQFQPNYTDSPAVLEVALDEPVIEIPKAAVSPGY